MEEKAPSSATGERNSRAELFNAVFGLRYGHDELLLGVEEFGIKLYKAQSLICCQTKVRFHPVSANVRIAERDLPCIASCFLKLIGRCVLAGLFLPAGHTNVEADAKRSPEA